MTSSSAQGRWPLSILVVDDFPAWMDDIVKGFIAHCAAIGQPLKLEYARDRSSARALFKTRCLHGASLDQRMPEDQGALINDAVSTDLITSAVTHSPSTVLAVYTAYADLATANRVGAQAGVPYIAKNGSSGALSSPFYARFFIKRVLAVYINQVLDRVEKSGWSMLHETAKNAAVTYRPLMKNLPDAHQPEPPKDPVNFEKDEDAEAFLVKFGLFREHLMKPFAAMSLDLARFGKIEIQQDADDLIGGRS